MSKIRDIIIIGAGGTAMITSQVIEDFNDRAGEYNIVGFLDDDESKAGREFFGYPIIGKPAKLLKKL